MTVWTLLGIAAIIIMQILCAIKLLFLAKRQGCSLAHQALALFRGHGGCEAADDSEVRDQLARRLTETRLQCSRIVVFTFWVAMCIVNVQTVMDELLTSAVLSNHSPLVPRVALASVLAIPSLRPSVLGGEKSAVVLYILAMLCVCVFAAIPSPDSEWNSYKTHVASTAALGLSGLCPRFSVIIVPNICLTLSIIAGKHISSKGETPDEITAVLDVFLLIGRLAVCIFGILMMELCVRKEVDSSFGRCRQSAVSALLRMMCDASVDMDGDLHLKRHSPELAGMLMHGPGRSLQGESLLMFMPEEEDQSRFKELLLKNNSDAPEGSEPGMVSVRLRDAIGNHIKVFLYHVPYVSIGGHLHHIVGLREDSDVVGSEMPQEGAGLVEHRRMPEGSLRPDIASRLETRPHGLESVDILSNSSGSGKASAGPPSRGGGLICSGSCSRAEPEPGDMFEIFVMSGLPVRWAAKSVQDALGIGNPLDATEDLPSFGKMLPDGGTRLLRTIADLVRKKQHQGREGNFLKCLGVWEISLGSEAGTYLSMAKAEMGAKDLPTEEARPSGKAGIDAVTGSVPAQEVVFVSRVLWVNFMIPVIKDEQGFPFVAFAATDPDKRRVGGQRGTAAGSTREALCDGWRVEVENPAIQSL